jgi:sulfoxide reductase heme-binding subunit YedZ
LTAGVLNVRAKRAEHPWLAPGVLVGALLPLLLTGWRAFRGELGANPIAVALHQCGLLALIFLLASLSATPLKRLLGWTWPMRLRRLLGLLGFFYASLHVLIYVALDRRGELATLLEDFTKRPFTIAGFAAWLLLVPLALTSTRAMVKRLGFVRWQRLHRLSYLAAALAAVHFLWGVKKDLTEPLVYGAVLALLLWARVRVRLRSRALGE